MPHQNDYERDFTMTAEEITIGGVTYPVAPIEMPRSETPQAGWFAFTPTVSKAWLKWNRSNRNIRKNVVASHAADMDNEDWGINGETVKVSRPIKSGEVDDFPEGSVLFLDGQHRFNACVESGRPFATLVVWGLAPEARDTVDSGIARNMSDVLKMNGENLSPVLAAVLRRVWMWDQGDRRFVGSRKPSHAELLALLRTDPQGFRNAADKGYWVRTKNRLLPPSVIGTAYYILSRVSAEEAPWFFAAIRGQAVPTENHPILTLQNRLVRDRLEKRVTSPQHQLAMVIRAWNAYRANEPLMRMDQAPDAATPDPK